MDLIQIIQKGQKIVSDLKHGGVNPDHIELTALDVLSNEILEDIGEVEKYDDVKKALINMFFFGQISKNKF